MRGRAFSLAETIIASFILLGAMVVFFALMHTMLRQGVRAQQRAMAALAAESKLEEIREWALDVGNFQSTWGTYNGQTSTDPAFPGLTLQTDVEPAVLFSPSTQWESNFADQRVIRSSVRKVRVRVRWPQDGGIPVELITLIADPPREPHPTLTVSGGPGSLSRNRSYVTSASARDVNGFPIHDLFFSWYTLPGTANPGNGQISSNRSGTSATFLHRYNVGAGPAVYIDGSCRAGVTAFYRGRPLEGAGNAVNLVP